MKTFQDFFPYNRLYS